MGAFELARKAKEKLYRGRMTVFEVTPIVEFGKTKNKLVMIHEDIPCKLSRSQSQSSNSNETADSVDYSLKLFCAPELNIKAGSQITVIQDGMEMKLKNSGDPFKYSTHQEIVVMKSEKT